MEGTRESGKKRPKGLVWQNTSGEEKNRRRQNQRRVIKRGNMGGRPRGPRNGEAVQIGKKNQT